MASHSHPGAPAQAYYGRWNSESTSFPSHGQRQHESDPSRRNFDDKQYGHFESGHPHAYQHAEQYGGAQDHGWSDTQHLKDYGQAPGAYSVHNEAQSRDHGVQPYTLGLGQGRGPGYGAVKGREFEHQSMQLRQNERMTYPQIAPKSSTSMWISYLGTHVKLKQAL